MNLSDGLDFFGYLSILRRRWIPASLTFVAVFTLLLISAQRNPSVYRAQGQLRLNRDATLSDLVGLDGASSKTDSTVSQYSDALDTEIQVMSSLTFLQKVVDSLKGEGTIPSDFSADELQGGLSIEGIENTDIIQVAFNSEDPRLAQVLVNQLMSVYLRSSLQSNRAKTQSVSQFISEQLPGVKRRVFDADSILRRFKETYGVTDLPTSKASLSTSQAKVQDQLDTVSSQLADLDAQSNDLRRKLGMTPQQALTVSTVSQSGSVQDILKEVEKNQQDLAGANARYAPDHPVITELQDRQNRLQALLKARLSEVLDSRSLDGNNVSGGVNNIQATAVEQDLMKRLIDSEATRLGLLSQQTTLSSQLSFYQKQVQLLPGVEQRLREYERELTAAESTYQTLLKSLQDIKVTENQIIASVQIIDLANLPSYPVLPNRQADAVKGAFIAFLVAIAVIYVFELLDRKLKSVDAVREAYPYTLLGTIPRFDLGRSEGNALPVLNAPRSPVSESYRIIQAKLKLLKSDLPLQTIAMTSALPQEGKSTTCANLALALSQVGHRVLLVDADLRRPSQHQIWELDNAAGLSNFLAEPTKDFSLNGLTHKVAENLEVITSGTIPPNPLALIDSLRMQKFLQAQTEVYDYVLLDTPPMTAAADPLVLGNFSDGLLVVARPGTLDKGSAKFMTETLSQSITRVLGMVINGVILKNESYSYHYYTNSYYGESDQKKLLPQQSPE